MTSNSSSNPNSLAALTGRLVGHLRSAYGAGVFAPISACADRLGVPKRRIYDIINVLEGVDFLEKQDLAGQINVRIKGE